MAGNKWVSPSGDKWALKTENSKRASKLFNTQAEAIKAGIASAKKDGVELIIQRPDGRIRSKDSYGNDPYPPRDTEH